MADKSDDKKIETNDDGDAIGTGNDARLKMLAQINDQNDKQLAEGGDLADVNDDGTTTAFSADENLTDEEIAARELKRAEDEANAKAAEEAGAAEQHAEEKHKIKVNGKELELSTQELIERAQKIEAADEYLKEAAAKLREAEAAKPAAKPQPSEQDVAAAALEERRALVRAIQMGTEDEAMAAIEKLQSKPIPSVSADDVARTVDERLTFNDAVSRFQTEFKDLADDPVLLNIVLQRDKDLIAQGDKRTYWERYDDIGKSVRAWKESIAKPAEKADDKEAKPDKQTRKASAPAVPAGAGTKAPAATSDEDKEETVGEVISAMAKARGGPQWLRG